jgi:hypothetical protein
VLFKFDIHVLLHFYKTTFFTCMLTYLYIHVHNYILFSDYGLQSKHGVNTTQCIQIRILSNLMNTNTWIENIFYNSKQIRIRIILESIHD